MWATRYTVDSSGTLASGLQLARGDKHRQQHHSPSTCAPDRISWLLDEPIHKANLKTDRQAWSQRFASVCEARGEI